MKRRTFLKMLSSGGAFAVAGGIPALCLAYQDAGKPSYMKGKPLFEVCDAHFHYVDFLQHTDGVNSLIKVMDANGVKHIAFWGMPLVKKWDKGDPVAPKYYLDNNSRTYWYSGTDFLVAKAYMKVPDDQKYRFHPFLCGFNCTDKYAIEHVVRMMEAYPGLWQGIGEILAHRDDLTNLTYGETARGNHEALDPVYSMAGQLDMPVNLHNNATSRAKQDEPIYVYEVEDVLSRHKNTRLVWAHAGLSRYFTLDQEKYTQMLDSMFSRYPNLYIDLSWLIYDDYVTEGAPFFRVRQCWLDLIKKNPERVMIGTDAVGHYQSYAMNIRKYYSLLQVLPPDAAHKVAYSNFISILPKKVREGLTI